MISRSPSSVDQFKALCTNIVETAHDHPGDGLRALTAALRLCKFDRDHFAAVDVPRHPRNELQLTLTREQAVVLFVILSKVGGLEERSGRMHADKMLQMVHPFFTDEEAEAISDRMEGESSGSITFKDTGFM